MTVTKIIFTRCQIFHLKCTKFNFGWSSAQNPARELTVLPRHLAGFVEGKENGLKGKKKKRKGVTVEGKRRGKGEGKGRGEGGKGKGEGKRREMEGKVGRNFSAFPYIFHVCGHGYAHNVCESSKQADLLASKQYSRPFAGAHDPAGNDPQRQHEHDKHCAWTDRHQRLQNEPRVQLYSVEGADTARRRVGEQPAVKQQHPSDEVEPQEHRQRQYEIHGHLRGGDRLAVGVYRPPGEVVSADRRRVNDADDQLDEDLEQRAERHGDPPVFDAVVDHE